MTTRRRVPIATPPSRTGSWWAPVLLVAATTAVYANSLSLPFVFDDRLSIVENDTIRSLSPLTRALWAPAQSAPAGRPAVNLSLALNYAAGGLSPWGYHAFNLVVHLLCGLLLFGIVRRTLSSERETQGAADAATARGLTGWRTTSGPQAPGQNVRATSLAFACALLWLLHPLQSEVVDYVTQRTESMMGLAYLTTLYASIRSRAAGGSLSWNAAAVVACAVGMACKEAMATAPVAVLLYDIVFGAGSLRGALKQRPGFYAALAACWVVLIPLVASGARSHSAGLESGITPWAYLLNQPAIIVRYLRLTVWPVGLVLDYGPTRTVSWQDALPSAVPIVGLAIATAIAWRTRRRLAFLGTWFFVTLAPTSSVVPIATEVGAERRMYLPLAAVIVFAVIAVARLSGHRRAQAAALAAVSATLGALTLQRNAEYRDPPGIWQTVIDRYPHGRAHYNRGIMLKAAGRRDEAIREFETAALDLPDAEYALGFERASEGRHLEAVQHLRLYTNARPDDVNVIRAYNLIGRSLVELSRFDEAVEAFRQVLRMQPRNLDAWAGLADSRLAQKRLDDAVEAYREYERLAPGNIKVYANLGIALGRLGRHEEAIASLNAAIALEPREAGLRMNLAGSLAATGRFDEAIGQCRLAIELEPDTAARKEIEELIAQLDAWKRVASR